MSRIFVLSLIFLCLGFSYAGDVGAREPGDNEVNAETSLSLELFGQGGALVPTAFGSAPRPAFFTGPQTREFAERASYTAIVDMDQFLLDPDSSDKKEPKLEMVLDNVSESNTNVIVSFVKADGSGVKNYLIPIMPGGSIRVDLSTQRSAKEIHLVSKREVMGYIEDIDGTTFKSGNNINFTEPEVDLNAQDKLLSTCTTQVQSFDMRSELIGDKSVYADVIIKRTYRGLGICSVGTPPKKFEIDVYWPNSTTLHGDGQGSASYCGWACNQFSYSVLGTTNGNKMVYKSRDHLENGNWTSVDVMFFNNDYSIAYCQTWGGGAGGTDCTSSYADDFRFYVYKTDLPSPQ